MYGTLIIQLDFQVFYGNNSNILLFFVHYPTPKKYGIHFTSFILVKLENTLRFSSAKQKVIFLLPFVYFDMHIFGLKEYKLDSLFKT